MSFYLFFGVFWLKISIIRGKTHWLYVKQKSLPFTPKYSSHKCISNLKNFQINHVLIQWIILISKSDNSSKTDPKSDVMLDFRWSVKNLKIDCFKTHYKWYYTLKYSEKKWKFKISFLCWELSCALLLTDH